MLKFTRSTDGANATYKLYDGASTMDINLNMLNEVVSCGNQRLKLSHDKKRDIPEIVSIIKDLGMHVKTQDFESVRNLVEDMYDISAIKIAEMY